MIHIKWIFVAVLVAMIVILGSMCAVRQDFGGFFLAIGACLLLFFGICPFMTKQ